MEIILVCALCLILELECTYMFTFGKKLGAAQVCFITLKCKNSSRIMNENVIVFLHAFEKFNFNAAQNHTFFLLIANSSNRQYYSGYVCS